MQIAILTHEQSNGRHFITTNRLHEEIINAGYEPLIIDYLQSSVAVADGEPVVVARERYDDPGTIVDADVVIPNFDINVEAGLLALEALQLRGAHTTQEPEAIRIAENKMRTHMMLAQAGVPTPDSITNLSGRRLTESDLEVISSDPGGQIVVKPISGARGEHVGLADNWDCTQQQSGMLAANNIPHLAQEHLPPPPDTLPFDRRRLIVGGMIVARMQRHVDPTLAKLGEFRAGISCDGIGTPLLPMEGEDNVAVDACDALGLYYGAIDTINGKIVDVNPFPGYTIEKITGINIAAKYIEFATRIVEEGQRHDSSMPTQA